MPGKPYKKKMEKSSLEMDHAMKMKNSPMPMKGPYNMKPGILRHMKSK